MMEKISIEQAKVYAAQKRIKPGVRKGRTDVVTLFRPELSDRFDEISWEKFGQVLQSKGLAVYYDRGFMRIMKA